MVVRQDPVSASSYSTRHDHTLLVLQGGGALGAYQAGVYEALSEQGFAPDWVTGVSIGAINAALVAGNPPALRVPRLREFWERVSSGMPLVPPAAFDPFRRTLNLMAASTAATFGVPGFFHPRIPPVVFAPQGTARGAFGLRHGPAAGNPAKSWSNSTSSTASRCASRSVRWRCAPVTRSISTTTSPRSKRSRLRT